MIFIAAVLLVHAILLVFIGGPDDMDWVIAAAAIYGLFSFPGELMAVVPPLLVIATYVLAGPLVVRATVNKL